MLIETSAISRKYEFLSATELSAYCITKGKTKRNTLRHSHRSHPANSLPCRRLRGGLGPRGRSTRAPGASESVPVWATGAAKWAPPEASGLTLRRFRWPGLQPRITRRTRRSRRHRIAMWCKEKRRVVGFVGSSADFHRARASDHPRSTGPDYVDPFIAASMVSATLWVAD